MLNSFHTNATCRNLNTYVALDYIYLKEWDIWKWVDINGKVQRNLPMCASSMTHEQWASPACASQITKQHYHEGHERSC